MNDQSINQSIIHSYKQSTNQSINESIDRFDFNQSINQPLGAGYKIRTTYWISPGDCVEQSRSIPHGTRHDTGHFPHPSLSTLHVEIVRTVSRADQQRMFSQVWHGSDSIIIGFLCWRYYLDELLGIFAFHSVEVCVGDSGEQNVLSFNKNLCIE